MTWNSVSIGGTLLFKRCCFGKAGTVATCSSPNNLQHLLITKYCINKRAWHSNAVFNRSTHTMEWVVKGTTILLPCTIISTRFTMYSVITNSYSIDSNDNGIYISMCHELDSIFLFIAHAYLIFHWCTSIYIVISIPISSYIMYTIHDAKIYRQFTT